jgi:phosphohistidine swiveling domain-containing protein
MVGEGATDDLDWTLEAGHFPDPVTRWSSALFTTTRTAVVERLMAEVGVLLDGIVYRELDGRIYTAVVPLGGASHKPRSRWLLPIVSRTSSALRQRLAAAHAADVDDWYGRVVEEWQDHVEDDLLQRGRGYLAGDLAALSEEQVAARLDEQLRFVEEGLTWYFQLYGACVDAIGRLGLELTRDHGWTVVELMDLFAGLSHTTTDPLEAQAAIVECLRAEAAVAASLTATTVADLAEISPSVAAALAHYQERWGQRAVRYEIAYPTVRERPEWLLHQLRQAVRGALVRTDLAAAHEAARLRAEARLIATLGNTSLTRRRLGRAQRVFPLREACGDATIGVPIAGLRRLGLHLGIRLGLYRPEDAFDLTFDEVHRALRHPERMDETAGLAGQRREEREKAAASAPVPERRRSGHPGRAVRWELGALPKAATENLAALLWFADQVNPPPSGGTVHGNELAGLGVSRGTYEGVARVVRDEDDFERLVRGDVMVCPTTSPVWSIVFPCVGALVCDAGGALGHAAIIAREFGLPAVVGTGIGTSTIPDGGRVRVDGTNGRVVLLDG